ncbi:MAG: 7-cyano-7-deazaguanine synthase QueC [Desulfovibrionaceae bacterium]|nr:7-cyano-7-deazaguanine synthase QueC [Desulfovibrionaceae bacterium]MBF0512813.1 7-cyano-7-deazaguanine synthase QueC [Desulfovibrionaceae bacterium]
MAAPDKSCVCLLSGGLDSTTCLAMAAARGFAVHALSFDYHQRHKIELEAAANVARALGAASHLILPLPLGDIGGSALTGATAVPKDRGEEQMAGAIPVTYVPARNTVFLAFALAYAETLATGDIFIGVNALDYSGYPDCRPEFIAAFEAMANLATKQGVEGAIRTVIHTPLIRMTKAEIVRAGTALGVDYGQTFSCYDPAPGGLACGRCDSCLLRKKGFVQAGLTDPARYFVEE